MADEQTETFIEKMSRELTLPLRTVGGRVFVENAEPDRLNRSIIELKCWYKDWHLIMLDEKIRIGEDKHKPVIVDEYGELFVEEEGEEQTGWSLAQCPIILSIHRVEDGWFADNAARDKDDPILGRFNFSAPIQTSDGLVNDKRAMFFAWIALGEENFGLLRDRLLANETSDLDLGLTVQFPRKALDTGLVDTKVHWDGKGSLPVTDAKIVWKCADWDSKSDAEVRELEREIREPELEEYEPPREHVELMDAVKRLETSITKLFTPLWIVVGAAFIAIWMA